MGKLATRDGYGNGLIKLGETNPNVVVLDAGVSDSTRSQKFGEKFPEKFFNVGISESELICAAAGFAICGKVAFASGFTCFLIGRTLDQTLVSVAYSNTNVKIVGSHSGIATGPDGPTAQAIQDVGWMRAMPNMTIISPCDGLEAEKATIALAEHEGPAYLRLARPGVETVTKDEPFVIGKGKVIQEGSDVTLISSGVILQEVLEAANQLKSDGVNAAVLHIPTIKPLDTDLILKYAEASGAVVTIEDHSIIGGLGSAVAEVLAENPVAVLERIGVKDVFAESGEQDELYKKYGLDAGAIASAAKSTIAKKKTTPC